MGVVQIKLPDTLQQVMDRQIADGLAASPDAYVQEALRRFSEDLDAEGELVAEAQAGIANADAGRMTAIANATDAEAWYAQKMARLQKRLADDRG